MTDSLYPPNPVNLSETVIGVSPEFKKEVSKVLGSILLFLVVYLVLILLAVTLTIACVVAGIWLIMAFPRFITLMIGIGIAALGVMVFFFLIKFIFAVNKHDKSGYTEITKADQPQLFEFIKQLTKDTHTRFPKKIYLSPEVNACVFYNSSFWSMFFPVRKNLQIGLALVNSLTLAEFKAVMAHEFGHFSQKSMKLGSFVYNVNQVIFNMLYRNEGYGSALQHWSNVSGYFAFFSGITVQIIKGIQYILKEMYGFINKNYMGLSRQMEFHADAVAATVSGSNNCINALRRLELSDSCYNVVINKYNDFLKQNFVAQNLYADHISTIEKIAGEYKLELHNELPVITKDVLDGLNTTRVNFKDQWASHPSMAERIQKLEELNIECDTTDQRAWILFADKEGLQQQITAQLYKSVSIQDYKTLVPGEFKKIYTEEVDKYKLPDAYKGFYEGRVMPIIDIDECIINTSSGSYTVNDFDDILSAEHAKLPKKLNVNENDVLILSAIKDKQIQTKTFDFDGEKYEKEKAEDVLNTVKHQIEEQKRELETLDKELFRFFYCCALKTGNETAAEFKNKFHGFFVEKKNVEPYSETSQAILEVLQEVFGGNQFTLDEARNIADRIKEKEDRFKKMLEDFITRNYFSDNSEFQKTCLTYISSNYVYFSGKEFFDNELQDLHYIITESWSCINQKQFMLFKELLQYQLYVYDKAKTR